MFQVKTQAGETANPRETIFPIMKRLSLDHWQTIGTGFFITMNGMFLTAKHVLEDVIANDVQTHEIAALSFTKDGYLIRPVIKGYWQDGDVAAGLLARVTHNHSGKELANQVLAISSKELKVGDNIHTYAYPKVDSEPKKIWCHPNFFTGIVTEYYPQGRDKYMLPNECYQTNMLLLGGASGGPVFNLKGQVVGINSSGYSLDMGEDPISFISGINEIFEFEIGNVTLPIGSIKNGSLGELAKNGFIKIGY